MTSRSGKKKRAGKTRHETTAPLIPGRPSPPADTTPLIDEEWLHLAEGEVITRDATDLMRLHKRLMQVHYRMEDNRAARRCRTPKRHAAMPLSIDAEDLNAHLARKLDVERVFLRDDLTLASLARELDVEPHHLSRFLNMHLHTTFNDLISACRVKEAKSLLINEPGSSILDIAFSSGFNSKASFNRVFKKLTGQTPRQYRLSGEGRRA